MAAVQWSRNADATPLGLIISDPEQFARKWSTHLFHPEYGLSKTMLTVIIDGVRYQPDHASTRVVWYPGEKPTITALWMAGDTPIIEHFWCGFDEPVIVREITVGAEHAMKDVQVQVQVSLYGNPAIFSEFLGSSYGLAARGYDEILVSSYSPGDFHERTLTVPMYQTSESEGSMHQMALYYSLGGDMPKIAMGELSDKEKTYWSEARARWTEPNPNPLMQEIERIFSASACGLRAAVSDTGRFDASIWQYGYEWSGDASIVAEAAIYSGQFELAQNIMENILHRLTIDEGMAMESSRFRGGKDSELNNNGEILKACRTYLDWTGDLVYIQNHYDRIKAIADYLLLPEFLNAETGMLMASRDIWERNEATGILPGYDVSHQTFGILGLRDAAFMATALGQEDDAQRWSDASKRMRESFLNHPTHSMVEGGRIIKRRLLDGSVQTSLQPATGSEFARQFMPNGMPLAAEGEHPWEPDISELFPICYGLVDPRSEIAHNTIAAMDTLWSQAWPDGGYGRYNVLSEPDSPGPWPFATMFAVAAAMETGDFQRAQHGLDWLINSAGAGASWFEFYGDRPTPPLPPTGIIVWGWAQWITLVVRHLLGAHVENDELVIRPRLGGFSGAVRFRDGEVRIP